MTGIFAQYRIVRGKYNENKLTMPIFTTVLSYKLLISFVTLLLFYKENCLKQFAHILCSDTVCIKAEVIF